MEDNLNDDQKNRKIERLEQELHETDNKLAFYKQLLLLIGIVILFAILGWRAH